MLCRRLNKIPHTRSSIHHSSQYRCAVISRSKCSWINSVFSALKTDPMSSFRLRLILRDLSVTRLWNAWFRTQLVSSMVKRCRRDRGVRDMLASLRQTFLRPSRTLLLSATAACQSRAGDDDPEPCQTDITDSELEELTKAFEGLDELSRTTLFCEGCKHRLVIDKKNPGVTYCTCPNTHPPGPSADGWVPYMEAEDVVIWRKEYKPGGQYAYKVYGRYNDLTASTFATVQLDGAYRRAWDDAVAALALVEQRANGVRAQSVLHWEVAWPRLFSNRDYVYIRRHKQFDASPRCLRYKDAIFGEEAPCQEAEARESVHSRARRKARELERGERARADVPANKVYVILSRSCTHPAVPPARSTVRVHAYWSHMAVRSLRGPGQPGMEFVLTYYDEPSVGGLPGGVSSWATGRAAAGYLAEVRRAAAAYRAWRGDRADEELDFEPFGSEDPPAVEEKTPAVPVIAEPPTTPTTTPTPASISPTPASITPATASSLDKSTQTEEPRTRPETPAPACVPEPVTGIIAEVKAEAKPKVPAAKTAPDAGEADTELGVCEARKNAGADERDDVQSSEPEAERNTSWWRYLYPFYYFV